MNLIHQGPVLAAVGRVAWATLRGEQGSEPVKTPGPELVDRVGPRPEPLMADFVRALGGSPRTWQGTVPPHFFPQWGFPLLGKTLAGIPYPMAKVLNQGCGITVHRDLPVGEPLNIKAQLVSIDDDGYRARIHQRLVTGTDTVPQALTADIHAVVAYKRKEGEQKKRPPAVVPANTLLLRQYKLKANAGWQFATLTGDVNPVHWVAPYAKAAGFKSVILHGYGTFGRAVEALVAERFKGDTGRLGQVEARFVRPLVLPRTVGVYIDGGEKTGARSIYVGDGHGGLAYMVGTFTERADLNERSPASEAGRA